MKFGCCVSTREQIDIVAQAGFDFCELTASAVRPFEDDATALPVMRALENAPLRSEAFNVLVPPAVPLVGPRMDLAEIRAYIRRTFGRMVRLGCEVVVLGSGGARRIPDGTPRDQALMQLTASISVILEEASTAGITLALEHLNRNETNVFNSVEESQHFIQSTPLLVDNGMRLLVDLYHIEVEQEPLTHVAAAATLIAHVHVSGGARRAPDIPGNAYAGFMKVLRATGYDERISAECSWEDLGAQAAGAVNFMRRSWERSLT